MEQQLPEVFCAHTETPGLVKVVCFYCNRTHLHYLPAAFEGHSVVFIAPCDRGSYIVKHNIDGAFVPPF